MSITETIQSVVDEMCAHYCKYSKEALEALEAKDSLDGTHCDTCPLLEL